MVPFLAPAFFSSLGQPRTQDSRFVFQRGKSSIFSAPQHILGGDGGARVRVEVVGGGAVQDALLGRCDALMVPQGEASTHVGLRGKLCLVGKEGEAVGHLSLSLSLRCLGEEVTGGAWGSTVADWRSHSALGAPSIPEKSFNIVQDNHSLPPHKNIPHHVLPPSEKIPLRIPNLQNLSDAVLRGWQPFHNPREEGREGVVLAQPPPILYLGPDEEDEKVGEKTTKMEQNEVTETQEHHQASVSISEEAKESEDDHHTNEGSHSHSHTSTENNTRTPTQHPTRKRRTRHSHHPPKTIRRQPPKHHRPPPPIARPQGWLRSTPPAPTTRYRPPRLNRSHLLRLTASDSQLGQNLKAEVERRVRSRVKELEIDFLEQMEKLGARSRSRRSRRESRLAAAATNTTHRTLQTVGCQTERAEVTIQVPGYKKIIDAVLSSSQSPSSPTHHQHHHTSSPQPSLFPPPPPRRTNTSKTRATQTETTEHTATDSPKERKEEKETEKHRMKETEKEPVSAMARGVPRVPNEGQRRGSARIRLGDMPKNLTYVIGSDGERMYAEGSETLPQKEEEEQRGERPGERREGKQGVERRKEREKTDGTNIRERTEEGGRKRNETRLKKKVNEERWKSQSHTTSSSSSSKPQKLSSPVHTPRPQPQPPLLREGKGQPLREPSQDTWGLTYTIRAEQDITSTSTQHKSTPSTRLTTPYTDDDDDVDSESWESSEVEEEEEVEEEVPSASSLSNEVCREIFKGRKADILSGMASSPPQSIGESLLSPSTSGTDSEQGMVVRKYSSSTPTPTHHSLKQKNKERTKSKQHKKTKFTETNSNLPDSYRASDLENNHGITLDPVKPSAGPKGLRDTTRRSSGTSISDISARIAALLVTKKINVAKLNTESVSSYVPSQQPSTMSSMSDVLMSSSSSFSG